MNDLQADTADSSPRVWTTRCLPVVQPEKNRNPNQIGPSTIVE
jgi:hypothetical protein